MTMEQACAALRAEYPGMEFRMERIIVGFPPPYVSKKYVYVGSVGCRHATSWNLYRMGHSLEDLVERMREAVVEATLLALAADR